MNSGGEERRSRSRTTSESSDGGQLGLGEVRSVGHLGLGGMCEVGEVRKGVSSDVDGKFTYSQV